MTETDFKVGDEVIVDNIYGGKSDTRVGAKGIITAVRAGGVAFNLRVENKGNYRFVETLVFYPNELKLVKPAPKFKKGDIVESVGFQYMRFEGKTLIICGESTDEGYDYNVRALGEDWVVGHCFSEDELVAGEPLAEWEIELLDADRPSLKSDTYGLSAKDEAWAQANKKGEAVKPLKIYLAGPMSGIEHYNFPAFFTAARELRKAGHTVFNPAENDLATGFNALGMEGHEAADHGFSLRDALKTDLSWICENAEALVLLEGWEGSKGVRAEMALAEALGLPKYEMAKLPVGVAK